MGGLFQFWHETDAVGRGVALVLLAMSVSAWVLIFWKGAVLQRAQRQLPTAVRAFWAADAVDKGLQRLQALDSSGVLPPLVAAAATSDTAGSLATRAEPGSQLTRRLRDALQAGMQQLQYGQVVLASIGSTAPFVGLFGTVWGIYHALGSIAASGSVGIDQVAGPVGEALVMTAAGLAVAIPAVLAYNLFGKWVANCEAVLEGFAFDLRELQLGNSAARAPAAPQTTPPDHPGQAAPAQPAPGRA